MLFTLSGCASRKKNTAQTRMYHAFFARYNTFYNGNVAYKKGRDAQIKGHKDNYLEQLPLMITDNENTRQIGKGDFDKAIEKAQKAIKNHSIKRKPRREAGKKLTEKKKRFYAQKEFNPFLSFRNFTLGATFSTFRRPSFFRSKTLFRTQSATARFSSER